MNRLVNKTRIALTRADAIVVLVVVVVLIILVGLLLPALARAKETSRRSLCGNNLKTIGQAMLAYSEDNLGYFPFSWGPADVAEPRKKDALASLGCLYPDYVSYAGPFRCPSTVDEPHFEFHVNESHTDAEHKQCHANLVLLDLSYGYDCRVAQRISPDSPLVADMDGTYTRSRDVCTTNHMSGQNVLFADGSVKWLDMKGVHSFRAASEDIYTENPWHADTDAFISDNTFGGMQRSPAGPDDLGPSYDPYPSLHPKP